MFGRECGFIKGGTLRPVCYWAGLLPAQSQDVEKPADSQFQIRGSSFSMSFFWAIAISNPEYGSPEGLGTLDTHK